MANIDAPIKGCPMLLVASNAAAGGAGRNPFGPNVLSGNDIEMSLKIELEKRRGGAVGNANSFSCLF